MRSKIRTSWFVANILFFTGASAVAQESHTTIIAGSSSSPSQLTRHGDPFTFSDMLRQGHAGKLKTIHVLADNNAEAIDIDGNTHSVKTPYPHTWAEEMAKAGVDVDFNAFGLPSWSQNVGIYLDIMGKSSGLLLMIFAVFFLRSMIRKVTVGELIKRGSITTRFEDIAGAVDAKDASRDIVEYLRNPKKFAMVPKPLRGVILVGEPGTGKTLVVKAIAGEAGVPFLSTSGSAFQEMYAGLGALRVRNIFKRLKKLAPVILFIDEVESLARHRGGGNGGAVERDADSTLGQMLVEMDGLGADTGIVVIVATNRPELLDPAFVRPGRFDRQIVVPMPDMSSREQIVKVLSKKVPVEDVDFNVIARGTPGWSGADLMGLVNEAALNAVKRGSKVVTMTDFETARDVKLLGGRNSSLMIDDEERKIIAVHEGGHAVVSVLLPHCDPIHKATIASRGRSLGHMASIPLKDRILISKIKLRSELIMTMAGRAAEEITFGDDQITSGAAADSSQATLLSRDMIARLGMGSTMANREDIIGVNGHRISEETRRQVEREVDEMVTTALEQAKELLTKNIASLKAVAASLLEKETMTGDEIRAIVGKTKHRELEIVSSVR